VQPHAEIRGVRDQLVRALPANPLLPATCGGALLYLFGRKCNAHLQKATDDLLPTIADKTHMTCRGDLETNL
jgi:hypothetical protein